jgi:hypothetical protein
MDAEAHRNLCTRSTARTLRAASCCGSSVAEAQRFPARPRCVRLRLLCAALVQEARLRATWISARADGAVTTGAARVRFSCAPRGPDWTFMASTTCITGSCFEQRAGSVDGTFYVLRRRGFVRRSLDQLHSLPVLPCIRPRTSSRNWRTPRRHTTSHLHLRCATCGRGKSAPAYFIFYRCSAPRRQSAPGCAPPL